eukprot:scaffold67383_cov25-Tisochrysis_lutea.AAC.2
MPRAARADVGRIADPGRVADPCTIRGVVCRAVVSIWGVACRASNACFREVDRNPTSRDLSCSSVRCEARTSTTSSRQASISAICNSRWRAQSNLRREMVASLSRSFRVCSWANLRSAASRAASLVVRSCRCAASLSSSTFARSSFRASRSAVA